MRDLLQVAAVERCMRMVALRREFESQVALRRALRPLQDALPCPDYDDDRICDMVDNCVDAFNPLQGDWDGDGIADICDSDDDNDGVPDYLDVAPYNPSRPSPQEPSAIFQEARDAYLRTVDGKNRMNHHSTCCWIA